MTPNSANYYIGGRGNASTSKVTAVAYDGRTIGGGLLVIYSNNIEVGSTGKFESYGKTVNGSTGAWKNESVAPYYNATGAGGGSGGGSINIFYAGTANGISHSKFTVKTGTYSPKGTYNVGNISNGTYISTLQTQ